MSCSVIVAMIPQTITQISRPLPPSRPIPPTPPRGTIYVVERFGRFSRLIPGNGPPLLPLVDRVIAAYARRVDQATPSAGILAVLSTNKRVIVNAKWSIRVSDARKLAYRISDVDRCVDMLVHVRIRDTLSTVLPTTDLDDPAVLKRISDAIRAGVDTTAARFGVVCPHFKVLSLRPAKARTQRSLNLAEVSPVPNHYANGVETVLPELPREAEGTGTQSFSSLSSLPPPNAINYPQPIAYPQPPQPARRPPALASVRLPPPLCTPTPANGELEMSNDELRDSLKMQRHAQSFRELPATSPEHETSEREEPGRMYARSQSLPQLLVSDNEALGSTQPSLDVEVQPSCGLHCSEDEEQNTAKPTSDIHTHEKQLGALLVSEDEAVRPAPLLPTHTNVQQLPRDTSSLTDDSAPPVPLPLPSHKREVIYAPPPSPTISNGPTKDFSVLPELLSNALANGIKKSILGLKQESAYPPPQRPSSPSERAFSPHEQASPFPERGSSVHQRVSPPPERVAPSPERVSPPLERVSPPPERVSPPPKRVSPPPERVSPPPERVSPPPERVSPPPERVSPSPERISPPPKRVSPLPERVLPPVELAPRPTEVMLPPAELASPSAELASTSAELGSPPGEFALPPSELASPPLERASPASERASPPSERASPLRERSSPAPERTSQPPASSSDGFSPPLASIFTAVAPTPHSELPSSERSSDSTIDAQDGPLLPSPAGSPTIPKDVNVSRGLASESSSDVSYKDAVDQQIPSPLMLAPALEQTDRGERRDQGSQTSQVPRSVGQPSQASQARQTVKSLPLRAGMPLLGPPMMPMPMEAAYGRQPTLPAAAGPHLGSRSAGPGLMSEPRSLASMPPRAPTPPMLSLSTPVREVAPGDVASGRQHRGGVNWLHSPVVAAEGLGPNLADPTRPLPLDVGSTHAAEVGSRTKHSISRVGQPLYGHETDRREAGKLDSGYSSIEAVRDRDVASESDDTDTATRGPPLHSSPLKQELRKRRQHVQTASLFSSVVGKAERAIKSAGVSLASELTDGPMRMIQTPSNAPRTAGNTQHTATTGVRMGPAMTGPQAKPVTVREGVYGSETETRRQVSGMSHSTRADSEALRNREMQRRGPEYVGDEAHPHSDGKRLRTTEEEVNLSRKEHARREKLMDELDKIQRTNAVGNQSSDDDSTRMMVDGGSDEERERFNDEVMSQSGAHMRRRREKSRHRRRHTSHDDDVDESDDSSSEEACTDCGRYHHRDGHGYSTSHRKGRSKSRSRRSEGSHHERSDYDSEPRSVSRSRSGHERKSTSEVSVDSHHSGRSSSRDRHRSKKSSSRDRKIEKSSSSGRSRSRDGKRSHSKSRSSSRKRDGDDKKRKESKSKSKSRNKHGGPTPEQLEYKSKETDLRSIYRHRLPQSDSGPENPIPWYCEGQSQPEDTDLDDYPGPDSSDSDDGKRSKTTGPVYSSYGSRDRHGRRHRAHHNKSVTFLYDNR